MLYHILLSAVICFISYSFVNIDIFFRFLNKWTPDVNEIFDECFLYKMKKNPKNTNDAKLRWTNYLENCIFILGITNVLITSAFRYHTQLYYTWRSKYLSSKLPKHKLCLCFWGSSQHAILKYTCEIFSKEY